MRPGTTEYALKMLFNMGMIAKLPLGTGDKLKSKNFPVAISFIFGDNDWVQKIDNGFSKKIGRHYLISDSDHNIHMDNPKGLANCIIDDIFN
jgi:pimeloyl-ACP methyl ester carboxylesterase